MKVPESVSTFRREWDALDRNVVACLLSVVPGAGHLYKHHYAAGLGILIGGNVLMVFVAVILGIATIGLSLVIVPVLYWLGVAASAYYAEDWHGKHEWLHPKRAPRAE
ncbi:MAG: hypothetical protein HKN82_10890 [Akkermansiaceae bacterium]|nr:hypothetical protein [Akkermansiaceae bacterium]NNM28949.1 hypothetical protein [Akkermansiaceae bacterium]